MRIQYLADLHIEFMNDKHGQMLPENQVVLAQIRETDSDVLVLAGDTHIKGRTIDHAAGLANGRPVVVVAGNHEYYGGSYHHDLAKLRRRAERHDNVHFLENEAALINGVVFLGCTLWTNLWFFEEGPHRGLYRLDQVQAGLLDGMSDYRKIAWDNERDLQPFDTMQIHADSVTWLKSKINEYQGRDIVIVTHHAPAIKSVHERYHKDICTASFASHLDELVEQSGAKLWIHGHTHDRVDYMVGSTKVVSNCRGYDQEMAEIAGFDPRLILEI